MSFKFLDSLAVFVALMVFHTSSCWDARWKCVCFWRPHLQLAFNRWGTTGGGNLLIEEEEQEEEHEKQEGEFSAQRGDMNAPHSRERISWAYDSDLSPSRRGQPGYAAEASRLASPHLSRGGFKAEAGSPDAVYRGGKTN